MKSLLLVLSVTIAVSSWSTGCLGTDTDGGRSNSTDSDSQDAGRVRPDGENTDGAVASDLDGDGAQGDMGRPDQGADTVETDRGSDLTVSDPTEPRDSGSEDSPAADNGDLPTSDPGVDLSPPQVVFDLRDRVLTFDEGLIEELDEQISFTVTADGVALTLAANQGVLNQTTSGFGINSDGSGDDTDGIDGELGEERITLTFDSPVIFRGFEVSGFSGEDQGGVVISDGSPTPFSERGFFASDSVEVGTAETVQIFWIAGNGFSLDAIAVDLD